MTHLLWVTGSCLDGLGKDADGSDWGLQLMGDVGDEVTPHRIHAPDSGLVLSHDEHQTSVKWQHPAGKMRRLGSGKLLQHDRRP